LLINPFSLTHFKELAMARYAHPEMMNVSPARTEAVTPVALVSESRVEGSKTLAGMLLAASLASLLVVADQVISTWSDGHLLAGWVALWTVAFGALAFLATPLRRVSSALSVALVAWWAATRARRQEERMWEFACYDPRVMAELQCAISRHRG
jgi:hypothetical protein